MADAPFPCHHPKKCPDWTKVFLKWAYINLALGLLALLISVILTIASKSGGYLPSGFALSLIVLTMTIAATGMDTLEEHPSGGKATASPWLRRAFLLIMVSGAVLAAISTPSDLLRMENIDQDAVSWICAGLLLIVLPFGFWAHSLGLKGRDAEVDRIIRIAYELLDNDSEYLNKSREREAKIQALAAGQGAYNGVRL